jgi:hypothetical protein
MKQLRQARIGVVHETKEGSLSPRQVVRTRAVFIRTSRTHQGLTHQFNEFRDCLMASRFRRSAGCATRWYEDPARPRPLKKRG